MSRPVCSACARPERYCYCHLLQPVANTWPVCIMQHVHEARHPLNTARIAALSLMRCRLLTVGDGIDDEAVRMWVGQDGPQPLLVYPGLDSQPLDAWRQDNGGQLSGRKDEMPPLLFIDASWRKSRRLLLQSSWLRSLPRVALPPGVPSRYRIRREPRPDCISTLEAIVTCLTLLDDCAPERMYAVMDWLVERQITAMGDDTWRRNYADSTE